MLYGVDCARPPAVYQARRIWANGWRWMAVYVGGPRAAAGHHGWPNAAVGALAQIGFTFMPIYVGRTHPYDPPSAFTYRQGLADGDEANVLTGACGFDSGTPLALDAEAGDYQNAPGFGEYLRGFGERVNGAGHQLCLYSDTQTLNAFGPDLVDRKWGADTGRRPLNYIDPLTTAPPIGKFDPSLPPPWSYWQWCFGSQFDCNSAVDDAPLATYTAPA